jgi:ankyrin repeat protein
MNLSAYIVFQILKKNSSRKLFSSQAIVYDLIKARADVNLLSNQGNTALDRALKNDQSISLALLIAGADINIGNTSIDAANQTVAVWKAKEMYCLEISKYLYMNEVHLYDIIIFYLFN